MAELTTDEIFSDGQENINAANMNGIISRAHVQPDIIAAKVASVTADVADQFLVLKTDNTLARARFDTITNSVSSQLPIADSTKNGMLRQVSGNATDYVGGDNTCHPVSSILPPGMVIDFAGPAIPNGWLLCNGSSQLRATYPNLFAAIGVTFGSTDGTHFTLPNFTGRLSAGAGGSYGALGATGGVATVALAVGNLPSHAHPITDVAHSHSASSTDSGHTHTYATNNAAGGNNPPGTGYGIVGANTGTGYAQITTSIAASGTGLSTTQAVGSGTAFNILNPYLTMNKIIKT